MQEYFKIGEISRLYDIGVDSLRYYEKIGLLNPERGESGYRHYSIQDIWKLNIIRDLRQLNFSMEQIGSYLKRHSIASTLDLLTEEQRAIDEKIASLQKLKENVQHRMEGIREAAEQPLNTIEIRNYPERRCYFIPRGYSEEHEMDVLIKQLLNMDKEHLYLIGNNRVGTAISQDVREGLRYKAVFVIDDSGSRVLPGGRYLTVTYRGAYEKSRKWIQKLLAYAGDQKITLTGDVLELLLVDIHVSADEKEHITQLQVRIQ